MYVESTDKKLRQLITLRELKEFDGGNEGTIYAWPLKKRAVKILADDENSHIKASRLVKCMHFYEFVYRGLGGFATIPQNLIFDGTPTSPKVVGFVMENCQGWWELNRLKNQDFLKKYGLGLHDIVLMLIKIYRAVREAHKRGALIGDLNLQNIIFNYEIRKEASAIIKVFNTRLVDVDSWGFRRPDLDLDFPPSAQDPTVCHPRVLRALSEGKKRPQPIQNDDWWAFALLLSTCLLGFDPFHVGAYPRSKKVIEGMTVWNCNLDMERDDAIASVRIGSKMRKLLNAHLTCKKEGEFPFESLVEFYQGIISCKKCSLQFHKDSVYCSNCKTAHP
ncbi:MAG: hypothetical protein UY41_C0019G0008 [Candidatus Moranbacteria bacterium GW2011_GWE1_49_15]|nr:MAG: hypothetical protein UX75_C0018G0004 [Candidatus Moranbacteria bacterium GW2011_GWE2_47_10]KKW06620.1 MAG: hypothetical protein UY41_C0019G0008 [Candidatus Moranbacteria bacterium GW2011_GWE1_49_15]HBP01042.1 hypothetical protein [Candidatus Moranbacteria bacterium]